MGRRGRGGREEKRKEEKKRAGIGKEGRRMKGWLVDCNSIYHVAILQSPPI